MASELPPGPDPHPEIRCPKCSSTDIRRSMPRNTRERFARSVLPVRPFFCRSCEQRSWIWGRFDGSQGRHADRSHHPGGRELEARDRALARKTRRRLLRSAAWALLLGTFLGLYVIRCQDQRRIREQGETYGHEGSP